MGNTGEEEFTYIPMAQQQQQQQQQQEEPDEKKESSKIKPSIAATSISYDTNIPNDGSFLEMMKLKLQKEKEYQQQQNAASNIQRKNHNDESKGICVGDKDTSEKIKKTEDAESDEEGPSLPPNHSKA